MPSFRFVCTGKDSVATDYDIKIENIVLTPACGNCSTQYKRTVVIDNVIARSGKGIAGINTNYGDVARFTRLTVTGNPPICEKYTGNDDGDEPIKIGSGADGTHCIYSSSDIIRQ
jgi:pectate lyase